MAHYHALKKAYAPHVDINDSLVVPLDNTPERLLVVVLKDPEGYIQAVFRRKDMLDIETMNVEYARDLKATSQSIMNKLKSRLGIEVMQPWPLVKGKWTTVIDSSVMGSTHVDIPVDDESMVRIPTNQFLEAMRSSERKSIARSVDEKLKSCQEGNVNDCIREFTGLKIKRSLDETIELPPLSNSARDLLELRTKSNATLDELVSIIERDPSLTASILKWSKSSFYKNAEDVFSLRDAIGRVMGFDMVMNLAMGLTFSGIIEKPAEHPHGFMEYWQQAIWMSQISVVVNQCMPNSKRPQVGMSYLLGILHNFGYLVLNHVFPPYFKIICRQWEANRHLDTSVVEMQILGITREQISAQLFECWDMPPELIEGVRCQKDANYDGKYQNYVLLLSASRSLMAENGLPLGYELPDSSLFLDRLDVNYEKLNIRLRALFERRSQIESLAALL